MIQALIFDLDDTLYREEEFVMSGYRAVAASVTEKCNCSFDAAFSLMSNTFKSEGREKVFPALLGILSGDAPSLQQLVEIYREHEPDICLRPGYSDLLHDFARCYRLGILTDGLPSVQARKVKALGLEKAVNEIIYTWEFGRDKEKPHPSSFARMLASLGAAPEDALYIGDNPDKDCRGAHNAGLKFIQVQNAIMGSDDCECSRSEMPEFVIETLFQLPQLLRQMSGCESK